MKKLILICSVLWVALSCTPVKEPNTKTVAIPEATRPTPVPDANTERQVSTGTQQAAQRRSKWEEFKTAPNVPEGWVLEEDPIITDEEFKGLLDEKTTVLAEQGDRDAQCALCITYYLGIHIPRDYNEAAKWCPKAAEQEHAQARFLLGMMYYNGQGVPQDYKEAAKWFAKGC